MNFVKEIHYLRNKKYHFDISPNLLDHHHTFPFQLFFGFYFYFPVFLLKGFPVWPYIYKGFSPAPFSFNSLSLFRSLFRRLLLSFLASFAHINFTGFRNHIAVFPVISSTYPIYGDLLTPSVSHWCVKLFHYVRANHKSHDYNPNIYIVIWFGYFSFDLLWESLDT